MSLFHSAFDEFHEHFHADLSTQHKFNQTIFIPSLYKCPSSFIYDCIVCQINKNRSFKHYKTAILLIRSWQIFNFSISMYTKVPLNPDPGRNQNFYVFPYHFRINNVLILTHKKILIMRSTQ